MARHSSKWARVVLFFFALPLFNGCVQLDLVDSSREAKYQPVLGATYVTVKELGAFGIRRTIGRDVTEADYVLVLTPRGIAGPEVISSETITVGTRIRVIGVTTRQMKLFGEAAEYVIALENFDLKFGREKEVRIYHASGFKMYETPPEKNSAPLLNPEFFERLE